MGTISHNAIIVTTVGPENFGKIVALASEVFPADQISVQGPAINGYRTLFIGPDGSKEGWPQSHEGDIRREKFIDDLKRGQLSGDLRVDEWLEVRFGEGGTYIVDSSNN